MSDLIPDPHQPFGDAPAPAPAPVLEAQPRPWATWGLLAAMLTGFVVQELAAVSAGRGALTPSVATLYALGACAGDAVAAGEWQRLVTSWYLHGNVMHLVLNGIALLYAGPAVERWVGRSWLLVVFFVSELTSSLLSIALHPDPSMGFGASGAVMGVIAAAHVATRRLPEAPGAAAIRRGTLWYLILAMVPQQLSIGTVDVWGHLGGALGGAALAFALHRAWPGGEGPAPWRDGRRLAAYGCLLVAAGAIAMQVPAYASLKGEGLDEAKQPEAAVAWYRLGHALGNRRATEHLGYDYWTGTGVPADPPLAFNYIRQAAERGSSWSQRNLGAMYAHGEGIKADPAQAAAWFRKAAETGDAEAQRVLGEAYLDGDGVKADADEGRRWLERADAQGNDEAAYTLGFYYQKGQYLPHDDAKALHYLKRAGEQHHVNAMSLLGYMYSDGKGVKADFEEGARWTKQAAEKDDVYAQYNLGEAYKLGHGVPKDARAAYRWYAIAIHNPQLAGIPKERPVFEADMRKARSALTAGQIAAEDLQVKAWRDARK